MENLQEQKERLIKELIETGFLKTQAVVEAFGKVPREEFVLPQYKKYAYINEPLPIQENQTISQPLTVAAMTEALDVKKNQKILEVGAGSGYQAAILSVIVGRRGKIITTERIKALYEFAKANLKNYKNVIVLHYDGSQGHEKEAPYDRIIVTASAPKVPEPLLKQLKVGGKLVIPIGEEMFAIEKISDDKFKRTSLGYYVFVPLVGKFGHEG